MVELLFSLALIFIVYKIVSVNNSVNAALFLILLAISFSAFLFYFNVIFLAVLYLAVYIGAVAVFFLFVVMMTDLNSTDSISTSTSINFLLPSVFVGLLFSSLIVYLTFDARSSSDFTLDHFSSNIESIGFCMFSEHSGPFVLVALIILVALIGSIFITINSDSNTSSELPYLIRSQDMETQLSRSVLASVNLNPTISLHG